jgi:hypothetical protein
MALATAAVFTVRYKLRSYIRTLLRTSRINQLITVFGNIGTDDTSQSQALNARNYDPRTETFRLLQVPSYLPVGL